MEALGLYPENDDGVGAFQGVVDTRNAANIRSESLELLRNPHGGSAQSDFCAEFAEQENIGAGNAAVQNVAEDGEVEAIERAAPIANG